MSKNNLKPINGEASCDFSCVRLYNGYARIRKYGARTYNEKDMIA